MGGSLSSVVFQPPTPATYDENSEGIFWIRLTQDRKIPARFYEWEGREGQTAHFTILYSCGNCHDLNQHDVWFKMLRDTLHVNVLCYDYTGYGLNQGKPSEKSCYDDIFIAWSFLIHILKIPSKRIILMGASIGTGPTIELASQLKSKKNSNNNGITEEIEIAGVILQSPILSVLNINRHKEGHKRTNTIANLVVSDMFENYKKIDKVEFPIFIIHGVKDDIVPISHSQRLSERVGSFHLWKLLEIPEASHFNLERSDEYIDNLIEFIDFLNPEKKPLINPSTPPPPVENITSNSGQQIITSWLKSINLEVYAQKFIIAGYYDMMIIKTIDEVDLEIIGVEDPDHKEKILKAAAAPVPVPKKGEEATAQKNETRKEPQLLPHEKLLLDSHSVPFTNITFQTLLAKNYFHTVHEGKVLEKSVIIRRFNPKTITLASFYERVLPLCSLTHPHLVEVVGLAINNQDLYLLQPKMIYGTLFDFLSSSKLSSKQRLRFARHIHSALSLLHQQSPPIIHGNLTSMNIMIENAQGDTEEAIVKVTDYGFNNPRSIPWMAPEVYLGKSEPTIYSDVYSFGIVLFEIRTSKRPWGELLAVQAFLSTAAREAHPLIPATIEQSWATLFQNCWKTNPSSRPTTPALLVLLEAIDSSLKPREDDQSKKRLLTKASVSSRSMTKLTKHLTLKYSTPVTASEQETWAETLSQDPTTSQEKEGSYFLQKRKVQTMNEQNLVNRQRLVPAQSATIRGGRSQNGTCTGPPGAFDHYNGYLPKEEIPSPRKAEGWIPNRFRPVSVFLPRPFQDPELPPSSTTSTAHTSTFTTATTLTSTSSSRTNINPNASLRSRPTSWYVKSEPKEEEISIQPMAEEPVVGSSPGPAPSPSRSPSKTPYASSISTPVGTSRKHYRRSQSTVTASTRRDLSSSTGNTKPLFGEISLDERSSLSLSSSISKGELPAQGTVHRLRRRFSVPSEPPLLEKNSSSPNLQTCPPSPPNGHQSTNNNNNQTNNKDQALEHGLGRYPTVGRIRTRRVGFQNNPSPHTATWHYRSFRKSEQIQKS